MIKITEKLWAKPEPTQQEYIQLGFLERFRKMGEIETITLTEYINLGGKLEDLIINPRLLHSLTQLWEYSDRSGYFWTPGILVLVDSQIITPGGELLGIPNRAEINNIIKTGGDTLSLVFWMDEVLKRIGASALTLVNEFVLPLFEQTAQLNADTFSIRLSTLQGFGSWFDVDNEKNSKPGIIIENRKNWELGLSETGVYPVTPSFHVYSIVE